MIFSLILFILFKVVIKIILQIYISPIRYLLTNKKTQKKVLIILGTRPEVVKLAPIIKAFQNSSYNRIIDLVIVSTGQHSSMLEQTLNVFKIRPTINLNVMKPGQNLSQLTSKLLIKLDQTMKRISPDIVLVQGDTSSAFAGSLAAFYQHIPVGHVEAGLRTWNLKYPFPEEYDRQAIGIVAKYHFAATTWARTNLLKEGKNSNSIYLTGNPVVDSLFFILNTTKPNNIVLSLLEKIQNLVGSNSKIILFTTHRRENQGDIMKGFFEVIHKILKETKNLVVIFPMHKNPNVHCAFASIFPHDVLNSLNTSINIVHKDWQHLNRLLIIEPVDYSTLVHLMNICSLILTDSGGLQEEGTSLGKPVLILRTTTERPEAVLSGNAILVGINKDIIYSTVIDFLNNPKKYKKMASPNQVYGDGTAGTQIANIVINELIKEKNETLYYNSILSSSLAPIEKYPECVDIVIVLTVWKRETLQFQLELILRQTILHNKKIEIIVYQNGNHLVINSIIDHWIKIFNHKGIKLTYIHSSIETGYYGRFLIPLLSDTCPESYFIINDDDITFGSRYYENMIRVVDDGFLCTRNGRVFSKSGDRYFETIPKILGIQSRYQITYENDMEVDFGGHIWAGRIKWLKNIWKYPPPSFANCEDFWLSAILKTKFNITTKMPRCPIPKLNNLLGEFCACSIPSALEHKKPIIGDNFLQNDFDLRSKIMNQMIHLYNFSILQQESPEKYNLFLNYGESHLQPVFNGSSWLENCLFWA